MTYVERMPQVAQDFLAINRLGCDLDVVEFSERPPTDFGWFSDECREGIEQLVKLINETGTAPRCVVELGTFLGRSALWLADRFEYVICVDHWLGSEEHQKPDRADVRDFLPDLYPRFLANVVAAGKTNIVPVRMTTDEALHGLKWPDDVDLVWVDASHDYGSVWDDVFGYAKILSERGVICGDDYDREEVRLAVDAVSSALLFKVIHRGPFWMFAPDLERRQQATKANRVGL